MPQDSEGARDVLNAERQRVSRMHHNHGGDGRRSDLDRRADRASHEEAASDGLREARKE